MIQALERVFLLYKNLCTSWDYSFTCRAKERKNMDIAEIKAYLDTNKDTEEVKNYIGGLNPVTTDRANDFLNTEEGKKILQPKLDTYHAKGMESWKTNNLDKLYQERYTKENPDADPRDTAMNTLKAELEQMKSEGQRKELTIKTSRMMQERKLPLELLELLIGADETVTNANVASVEAVFKAHVETLVAERLKGGYQPPTGGNAHTGKNPFKQGPDFNLTEQGKMFKENPDLARSLMAQSK